LNNRFFRTRLGVKFVTVACAAAALACSVFLVLNEGLFWWLFNSSYTESFWKEEGRDAVADFQLYVTGNALTVDEAIRDVDWENQYETTYLYLIDASDTEELKNIRHQERSQGIKVKCSDGIVVAFAHKSANHYEKQGLFLSLLGAVCSFFAVLIPYVLHTIRRITGLSQEMSILTGGDLSYELHPKGKDELSELGYSIEAMRRSVIAQMQRENEAVLANSSLITSLSHDLRTPLTKLTGYLEILRLGSGLTGQQMSYIESALQSARSMKTLSDEMFRHFQVPDATVQSIGFEVVSGSLLLSQLIVETCCDLEEAGFTAAPPQVPGEFQLNVRVFDLRRICDNIYSNIKKYADPRFPVVFSVALLDGQVIIQQSNTVSPQMAEESVGVGLPTIKMLCKQNGGSARVSLTDREFAIEITLPIYAENNDAVSLPCG